MFHKKLIKVLLILCLVPFFNMCVKSNDFIITENRAGNVKLGDTEIKARKQLEGYKIEEVTNTYRSIYKYLEVYDDNTKILELRFSGEALDAIKVYSKKYTTENGVKLGNTAQEVTDLGYFVWGIVDLEDGFRAQIRVKTFSGTIKEMEKVYFYFNKVMTRNGEIGKNAQLKCIVLGYDF